MSISLSSLLRDGAVRRRRAAFAPAGRRVSRLVACAALIAAALAGPSPAAAGQYHVFQCETPSGRNVAIENLAFAHSADYVGWGDLCDRPGGSFNVQLGGLDRTAPTFVRASFYAPGATTIAAAHVNRRVRIVGPGSGADWSATPYWITYRNSPTFAAANILESCMWFSGCTALDWPQFGSQGFDLAPGATSLHWEVGCGGDPGGVCAGAPGNRAVAEIRGLHVVLNDSYAPTGSADGPALTPGVVLSGVAELSVKGTDTLGGGIYQAYATLDGVEMARATVGGECSDRGNTPSSDLDFERLRPCPTSASFGLAIDTRRVGDGRRRLQVYVRDAGGNVTQVADRAITVDNVPPPKALQAPAVSAVNAALKDLRPGDGLTVSDGVWEGAALRFSYQWQRSTDGGWFDIPGAIRARYEVQVDDIGARLRVVVRASNSEGETAASSAPTDVVKSGATVRPQSLAQGGPAAPAPAAGGSGAPQLVVDREQRTVQVSRGANIVVTGRLVDADGQPIAGAPVEVFEQVSVVGASWNRVAELRTDSQGGYAYRPATSGSRTLRFAYSGRRDDGDFRATRDVVVAVTAGMRLRAVRGVVRRGQALKLRGRVFIDPLPKSGTWVEVQVLDAGVWRTVATRRTNATGHWSFRHRVQRSSGVTFRFRARLRQVADVPAVESRSASVKVRVR